MTSLAPRFDTDEARLAAHRARDQRADGLFVTAVLTTGIYCRPVCPARTPKPENMRFYSGPEEAERQGYRPCKRCRPNEAPRAAREAELVARACRAIEAAETVPSLDALAAEAGLSPFHFHRLFRRIAGVTPRAYAAAQRARRVQDGLARGEAVTAAYHEAGYSSSGRFYADAPSVLGMAPSSFRAGGRGQTIGFALAPCSLGLVLVATTERGICAIALGDAADALEAELRARFPQATLRAADPDVEAVLAKVVALIEHPVAGAELPLDIRGTAFQRRVWEALQAIPPGQTLSYGALAAQIGQASAVRAVAAACAANALAVAIPCHRVIGADGALTGYRWGVARKRALLEREKTPG